MSLRLRAHRWLFKESPEERQAYRQEQLTLRRMELETDRMVAENRRIELVERAMRNDIDLETLLEKSLDRSAE